MLTASFGAARLPLAVAIQLTSEADACLVAVRIEDRWTSPTGKVWGDITTAALQIEPGGLFRGQSAMSSISGQANARAIAGS